MVPPGDKLIVEFKLKRDYLEENKLGLFHFQRLPGGGDLKIIRKAGVGGIK